MTTIMGRTMRAMLTLIRRAGKVERDYERAKKKLFEDGYVEVDVNTLPPAVREQINAALSEQRPK